MTKKQNVVYIFPTYNEKDNILDVLKATQKVSKKMKNCKSYILVVDDNSPDGTSKIVNEYRKKNRQVFLLSGSRNGLGDAMIRGIKYSINKLKADIVVLNEADMSYLPSESNRMINLINQGSDFVAACRVLKKNNSWPIDRKIIHWVSNVFFAKVIAGVSEVDDHNCAFRAIKVKGILDKINFDDFPRGFSFFNYLVFKLSEVTRNIKNYPVIYHPRTKGESKISFKPKHIKNLIKNFNEYMIVCFNIRLQKIFK